ncbi:MAG: SDR family NAD(P)-dependent oxidoreductase [Rhodospirillales bacterium]
MPKPSSGSTPDILDSFRLDGRVAVITGASEGIGRALSLGLAHAGADVVVCSRDKSKLDGLVAEIKDMGRRAEPYSIDISQVDQIEGLRDFVRDQFGALHILINGAAYTIEALAWDTTEPEWNKSIDTSLKGTYFACTILGTLMREAGYGKIINLSSTYARATIPTRSVYSAIKAAISHLTESLAVEWGPEGIRINSLAPTAVRTPSRAEYLAKFEDAVTARIPLGRIAETDDLLAAAVYLASPASDFVTGQTLFVDGGFVAHG